MSEPTDFRRNAGGAAPIMSGGVSFRQPPAMIASVGEFRARLAKNLSQVLAGWFPRSLDLECGGFLCDFDHAWRPAGAQRKRLEFQARQTRAAGQAAIFDPGNADARAATLHGFRYLTETMWDREHGGWFYVLHRDGSPVDTDKHLHGIAYAIQGCVEHHRMTGTAAGLDAALAGFDWLEARARDPDCGGYHHYVRQDGSPITTAAANSSALDPLGVPIGYKDCNTIIDMIDALADLFEATKDERVRERLIELCVIVRDRMFLPPGMSYLHYTRTWEPAADRRVEAGLLLQGASIFIKTSRLVESDLGDQLRTMARSVADFCLRDVWDTGEVGFFHYGTCVDGTFTPQPGKKIWWVQAEGLRLLCRLASDTAGPAESYLERCLRLWSFIDAQLTDPVHGGWLLLASSPNGPMANEWKDASHEVRALVECIRMCDGGALSGKFA